MYLNDIRRFKGSFCKKKTVVKFFNIYFLNELKDIKKSQ